jgi:DegV family protein with EDD domain
MSKIAFVTDSTAYIPSDLCKQHNITVVPQILIWGEQTYQDGVDIQPDEYYVRLKTAKIMPSTSQASMVTMQNTFKNLVDQDFDVVGIFISSKLSGTMQSATQGREALGKQAEKVTIIDSQSTAMAMGFQVLTVARAAQAGASLKESLALAEKAREHSGVYFAVDTLEFLHRGGRIGGGARFIGTALNMKPVLAVLDGRVEAVERIRTKGKAIERVIEVVQEQVKGKSNIRLAALHANAEAEAKALLEKAAQKMGAIESILTEVSPVVGTHAGPGTVGLAYIAGL